MRIRTAWTLWLLAAATATAPCFLWHVRYFRHPGEVFFRLLPLAAVAFAAAVAAYHRLRVRGARRFEMAALIALPPAAGLLYQPRATLVAAWIFIAAWTTGRYVMRRLNLESESPAEQIAVSAGVGLALLVCVLFFLGMAHAYYAPVFALLLAALSLGFSREIPALWRSLRRLNCAWSECRELSGWLGTLLIAFAALFLIAAITVILAPSVAFDVLRYHLAEAEVYSAQHSLAPLPYLDSSYFPQNVEVLMTLAFALGRQPAAQMTPPLFFALSLLLLFALVRRSGASAWEAFAGVVFAGTIPFLHWTGSVAKNDLALAFFPLAALYGYIRWQESGNFRWIQLGVFFFAAAAGVKYTAVFALPPLAVFFVQAALREARRARAIASLACVFAAFGLVWYIRAFLLTGNPVHPWTLGAAVHLHSEAGGRSAPLSYLALPWTLNFDGPRHFASPLPNPLGLLFVLFAPVWLFRTSPVSKPERTCLIFSAAYLLYWSIADPDLRFAIAPLLLFAALTVRRFAVVYESCPPWMRKMSAAVATYVLVFAFLAICVVEINAPQLRLFAGRIGPREYLRAALVTYPSLEYLSAHAGPRDRVLSIQNASAAYAPNPALFDCIFPAGGVVDWTAIGSRLRANGYRFVIVPAAGVAPPAARMGLTQVYADATFLVFRAPGNSAAAP